MSTTGRSVPERSRGHKAVGIYHKYHNDGIIKLVEGPQANGDQRPLGQYGFLSKH